MKLIYSHATVHAPNVARDPGSSAGVLVLAEHRSAENANMMYSNDHRPKVAVVIALLSCAWVACSAPSDPDSGVEAEMESAVADANPLFQFGCDPEQVCSTARVLCRSTAASRLRKRAERGSGAVVRYYSRGSIVGHVPTVWKIESDGSGTRFWEVRSDIRPCTNCGWHKREYGPGELRRDGEYLFRLEEKAASIDDLRRVESYCRPEVRPPADGGLTDADAGDVGRSDGE